MTYMKPPRPTPLDQSGRRAGQILVVVLGGIRPGLELMAELTAIPGIGPWTVQGAVLLALGRKDVVVPGDLRMPKAVQAAYRLDHLPT